MAGLLDLIQSSPDGGMGLLGSVLSRIDAIKRRAGGLLAPGGADQLMSSISEDARANMNLAGQGFNNAQSVMPDVASQGIGQIAQAGMPVALAIVPGYHGSGKDITAFSLDAPKTTGGGLNKYGVSMSPDPKVASRYAADFNPSGGAVVYPVQADLNKTMNLTATEFNTLQHLVSKIDSGQRLSELEDVGLEMLLRKSGVAYHGQHPIEAIKGAGYDSLFGDAGRFGAAEPEYLVFDPSKVQFSIGK